MISPTIKKLVSKIPLNTALIWNVVTVSFGLVVIDCLINWSHFCPGGCLLAVFQQCLSALCVTVNSYFPQTEALNVDYRLV